MAGSGLRSYLAVRGGIDVAPVFGSRSTDTLAGLGPPAVAPGDVLPVGTQRGPWPAADFAPYRPPVSGPVTLSVVPGPRSEWFVDTGVLAEGLWVASTHSNRIGLRLDRSAATGARIVPARAGELATEGVAVGSIQVPPSGQPVIFLADHPVTGGYPVVGVLTDESIAEAAQVRPGQSVAFRFV